MKDIELANDSEFLGLLAVFVGLWVFSYLLLKSYKRKGGIFPLNLERFRAIVLFISSSIGIVFSVISLLR
jgi:hypothetical protein